MNESANFFPSEENEIKFYESHVGPLTPLDIENELTLKKIFETNEYFCRLEIRRDKLRAHLEKYGVELFSGYARASVPANFVLECKQEIVNKTKQKKEKVGALDNKLCPYRNSGFQKISTNVKGKPRGLSGGNANMAIFYAAVGSNLLYRPHNYVCTKFNIYNFNIDDAIDEANELLVIRKVLHIWKRKKWPKISLDDLLREAYDDRSLELQIQFERVYFFVLQWGSSTKLPIFKFYSK